MATGNQAFNLAGVAEIIDLLVPSASQWAIYQSGTSDFALEPDSIFDLNPRREARVSDYPMEQGAFASYNKVQTPRIWRLRLVCRGVDMDRSDFLDELDALMEGLDLVDIATPDNLGTNLSLTNYDYKRQATSGVSMLIVDTTWEEIRIAMGATYSAADAGTGAPVVTTSESPSAAKLKNTGTVTVAFPTPAQVLAGQQAGYFQ